MDHEVNNLDFRNAECGVEHQVSGRREHTLYAPDPLNNHDSSLKLFLRNIVATYGDF